MTISIGNDHAGKDLKFEITTYLQSREIKVINVGTDDDISV
ncbi:MAG TPA: ribose-5-phosphate isomerase, partial [Acholeplasmataceae bacterium]|nr:ribose-5-phosphate isomerase [Acholeplasmataceae bacterium]